MSGCCCPGGTVRSSGVAYTSEGHGGPPLEKIPPGWWRQIELAYPDGSFVVIVYDHEPEDALELPALMWRLQSLAAKSGFRITIRNADGTTSVAEPFRAAG